MLERNRARQTLRATVEAIPVETPEDARDYILHHPRVLALEAEGMRRLHLREPAAAMELGAGSFTCEPLPGLLTCTASRSEERRHGNDGVSSCRCRWTPYH